MKKRSLGQSGITIAPLVFGGNVFGWTIDEKQSLPVLDAFVDHGFNMIDTANMYSSWVTGNQGGESESIIGNWVKQRGGREKIIIATKVGMPMGDGSQGLAHDYILKSAEESLRRLQSDYIDVYFAHQDDANTPLDETLAAFDLLIQQGKVRTIASSNYTAPRLQETLNTSNAKELPSYTIHQPEYNLFDRAGYEDELEQVCVANGLGVITYFSLASGFLSGKYRNQDDLGKSKRGAGAIEKYMTDRGMTILSALDTVADKHNTNVAAIALAWVMSRPSVTAPIVSATNTVQLGELAQSAHINLSEDDINLLNAASAY